jgi:Predicted RNA polymerase sigma factor containing a TPR repeat domain
LLEQQDRSLWDRQRIAEGCELVRQALQSRAFGAYTVQAAIAAVHAEAATAEATDWAEIVGLYDVLQRHWPSAVVELNRAVALAKRDGPEVGLRESKGFWRGESCWTITWRMRRGVSCITSWGIWKRPGRPGGRRWR